MKKYFWYMETLTEEKFIATEKTVSKYYVNESHDYQKIKPVTKKDLIEYKKLIRK